MGLTANPRGQTTDMVLAFVADAHHAVSYPVAVDLDGRTTNAMRLTGLPSPALVDRAGVVRWVGHPNFLSRAQIETLLAEPAPAPSG